MSKGRPKKGTKKIEIDIPEVEDEFEEEGSNIEEEENLDAELDFENHRFTDEFSNGYDED